MELELDLRNLRTPSPCFTELAGTDLACQSSLLWAEIAEQEKSLAFERKGQSSTWKKVRGRHKHLIQSGFREVLLSTSGASSAVYPWYRSSQCNNSSGRWGASQKITQNPRPTTTVPQNTNIQGKQCTASKTRREHAYGSLCFEKSSLL